MTITPLEDLLNHIEALIAMLCDDTIKAKRKFRRACLRREIGYATESERQSVDSWLFSRSYEPSGNKALLLERWKAAKIESLTPAEKTKLRGFVRAVTKHRSEE